MINLIGIIGRINDNRITFNQEIINIIYRYNFIPLGIILDFSNEPLLEFNKIKFLIDKCDGFILQGGTNYYDIDILITKYLYKKNIPTLGICLGMQTMAIAFNGIMGDIDNHYNTLHHIVIDKDSKLYDILNKEYIIVNSRHNNYIVSTNLDIGSKSNVIESVEDKSKDFFLGIQWHPESMNNENSQKLFEAFFLSVKKLKK